MRILLRFIGFVLLLLSVVIGGSAVAQTPAPVDLPILLVPGFDTYGNQFETLQAYGDTNHLGFGIYDTGASVVSFSADDQALFATPILVKTPNGAVATAIGGDLVGDVSQPGKIIAGGLGAFSINVDLSLGTIDFTLDPLKSVAVPGIQAFLGTASSPFLPTITGTPINAPSTAFPAGLATRIDTSGFDISSLIPGFPPGSFGLPDVRFVAPTSPDATLTGTASTYTPITIPVTLYGTDNTANPGADISAAPNPTVAGISAAASGGPVVTGKTFLFDTGAQISVISPDTATALGLDLNNPLATIQVQGAAGQESVKEFMLTDLIVPRSDAVGATVHFTNVPVFVLDVAPGIDGILGMNLFNLADSIVYNPYGPGGPALSMTFFSADPRSEDDLAALEDLLAGFNTLFADSAFGLPIRGQGQILPHLTLVPEPSAALLALVGFVALVSSRRRLRN